MRQVDIHIRPPAIADRTCRRDHPGHPLNLQRDRQTFHCPAAHPPIIGRNPHCIAGSQSRPTPRQHHFAGQPRRPRLAQQPFGAGFCRARHHRRRQVERHIGRAAAPPGALQSRLIVPLRIGKANRHLGRQGIGGGAAGHRPHPHPTVARSAQIHIRDCDCNRRSARHHQLRPIIMCGQRHELTECPEYRPQTRLPPDRKAHKAPTRAAGLHCPGLCRFKQVAHHHACRNRPRIRLNLKGQVRHPVGELRQLQILEHRIGQPAIGRSRPHPFGGFNQYVGCLPLAAQMHPHHTGKQHPAIGPAQQFAIGPDPPDTNNLPRRQQHRKGRRITITCCPGTGPLAAAG